MKNERHQTHQRGSYIRALLKSWWSFRDIPATRQGFIIVLLLPVLAAVANSRSERLSEGAASMPLDAPPADDATPFRLAAPTAACAGELHPLGQFRQSQSTGLAPPADTLGPTARMPSRAIRHAPPPPQKGVRLGRRVIYSLPNPRCSPDMALCSSHRAACDAPAHLCTCNHVTLMHNPALPKYSLYQLACCQTKHQCSIPLPPTNLRQIWATQSTSAESSAALSSPRDNHKTLDANVLEWTSNEEGNRKRMWWPCKNSQLLSPLLMSQLASIVNLRSTQLLIILEDQIICLIIDAFSCILISVSHYLHI
jgi:hypothetical protein